MSREDLDPDSSLRFPLAAMDRPDRNADTTKRSENLRGKVRSRLYGHQLNVYNLHTLQRPCHRI